MLIAWTIHQCRCASRPPCSYATTRFNRLWWIYPRNLGQLLWSLYLIIFQNLMGQRMEWKSYDGYLVELKEVKWPLPNRLNATYRDATHTPSYHPNNKFLCKRNQHHNLDHQYVWNQTRFTTHAKTKYV